MTENQETVELERRLEDLQQQQEELRRQLVEARSDQWQARIDDLDIQAHLAAMDAQEQLDPLVEKLRNAWLEARSRFDSGASTASDVIDQLRDGFEQAGRDIREALNDIRTSVKQ